MKNQCNMLVVISNADHPHFGCSGELTGEAIRLFGEPMYKVRLTNCKHHTEGCYISGPRDVKSLLGVSE